MHKEKLVTDISYKKPGLYTWNLKYHYLKPVFLILDMHLEFTTCTHKFKCLFNTEKPVLNAVFNLSEILNQIIIRFGMAKHRNAHFKAKNSPHTTQILDLKYALRCFAKPNQMLKCTLQNLCFKNRFNNSLCY